MLTRIALLLGMLCVPVLLALVSQALAASTDPPDLPESPATAVATVPIGKPSAPAARSPGAGSTSAMDPTPRGPDNQPRAVPVEPRPVGTPADLDGDRDDDGVPDEDDDEAND